LISNENGIVEDVPGMDEVRAMRSFHSCMGIPKQDEVIYRTVDLLTAPGIVYLLARRPKHH